MALEPVPHTPSRNISAVLYDPEERKLVVWFAKNGRAYQYADVPEDVALGFGQALSATEYLQTFIEGSFLANRIV